ncbi:MAG: flagellar brake protein [Methylotenera sp.]|nr:flagellar brake protein [Methylotenera sp.]
MEHTKFDHNEEQYIVHNPKEVMQILNDLIKHKAMLKVSFNHGADVYLTSIVSIDQKVGAVYLDVGVDEEFNRRLFASSHIVFLKEDGVKIKWTSTQVTEVNLKDGKAIKIALPKDLIRLQRRDYYRFVTPVANPAICRIPVLDVLDPEVESVLELTLVDVSLGGVGAFVSAPLNPALVIGQALSGCKIGFPDVGETNLTLMVRNITEIHTKDVVPKHRIGFVYVEPSRGNEGLINRYVYILERQAIALAHGGG